MARWTNLRSVCMFYESLGRFRTPKTAVDDIFGSKLLFHSDYMDFLGIFADRLPPAISQYDAAFVFLHFKKHLEVHLQERRTFLRYKMMFWEACRLMKCCEKLIWAKKWDNQHFVLDAQLKIGISENRPNLAQSNPRSKCCPNFRLLQQKPQGVSTIECKYRRGSLLFG